MDLDRCLDALLRHDTLFGSLPRFGGYTMRKAYTKPGLHFGLASKPLDPTFKMIGDITFFAQQLVVRDWMDIELLWKPWTLAVRPEALGKPACVKIDGGYALRVFVYDGPSACRFWDQLREELEATRAGR